jgi:phage tail-like protein
MKTIERDASRRERRGLIDGLPTPHPLGPALPGIYQQDDFAMRLASVFDDCLAPIFSVLDNCQAYFDPRLAPEDFVPWLASWVALTLDETWPLQRQRSLIARAAELYRARGTRKGLADHVELYTGAPPEVSDSGGVAWSREPGAAAPGEATPSVTIRVRLPDPAAVDTARLDAIVAASKPAHVLHRIEVVVG